MNRLLKIIAAAFLLPTSLARCEEAPPPPGWFGLYTAPCRPDGGTLPPVATCVTGDVWLESRHASSAAPVDRAGMFNLRGGVRLYLGGLLALHAKAEAERVNPYEPEDRDAVIAPADRRSVTEMFAQMGNPALHPLAILAGRGPLPFGFQHQTLHRSITSLLSDRAHPDPAPQLRIAFDNQRNRHLDLAVSNTTFLRRSDESPDSPIIEQRDHDADAITFRFFQDYPDLYATRLAFSGHGTRQGARSLGVALMNANAKEETTVVEYSRRRLDPAIETGADEVCIKVTYMGPWVQDTRIGAQIEDQSSLYRMGGASLDYRLAAWSLANFSLAYVKSESDQIRTRWLLTLGTGAAL